MGPAVEISGGSAANTIVGVASFGGRAAFIGRVARRPARRGLRARPPRRRRARSTSPPAADGPPTGRCLVIVTPDARAHDEHVPRRVARSSARRRRRRPGRRRRRSLYLEGYLWDEPEAKDAYRHAARIAHEAGNRVALTLSDSFCVDRHRDEFLELVEDDVDILFANEDEITLALRGRRLRRRARSSVAAPLRDRRAHPRRSRAR